jgi:hypothetical protein
MFSVSMNCPCSAAAYHLNGTTHKDIKYCRPREFCVESVLGQPHWVVTTPASFGQQAMQQAYGNVKTRQERHHAAA